MKAWGILLVLSGAIFSYASALIFQSSVFTALAILLLLGGVGIVLFAGTAGQTRQESIAASAPVASLVAPQQQAAPEAVREAEPDTLVTATPPAVTLLGDKTGSAAAPVSVSDVDRQSGMYVLGIQGTGKSSLIESLIFQDISKGHSVIVLDPHSDLINHVIAELPPDRLNKTYLLDIEDTDYPFGLNLFSIAPDANTSQQQQAFDRVLHVFEKCFPDTSRMLLEKYLGNIAPVFFANTQAGYGMTDIPTFLRDDAFREKLVKTSRLFIRQFWQDDYGNLSPSKRQGETASLATRLNRFMRSPIAGNIIGQKTTTIDFRKAIENKEILLIRLPVKTLKEDAQLIGTMLIAQIYAAIFSFSDTPPEQRPGFSLFVDEFQHFATSDFSDMFTEGRKFGSRVTVAHQFREQLPDYLEHATLTARTIVCFQATHEDAGKLARLFTDQTKSVQVKDIPIDPIKYLLSHGHENKVISDFVNYYLKGLDALNRGKSRSMPFKLGNVYCSVTHVEDARQRLTTILYECMREKRSDMYIPTLSLFMLGAGHDLRIPYAFDTRKSILAWDVEWDVTRWRFTRSANMLGHPDFLQDQQAIALFIRRHGARTRFSKRVNHGRDCIQMLFDLREIMEILAKEPLGDTSADTAADTAQKISNLPRRTALVKVGHTLAGMHTRNTPGATGNPDAKKRAIITQTRQTYCRPAREVEREIEERLGLHSGHEVAPPPEQEATTPAPPFHTHTPQHQPPAMDYEEEE